MQNSNIDTIGISKFNNVRSYGQTIEWRFSLYRK